MLLAVIAILLIVVIATLACTYFLPSLICRLRISKLKNVTKRQAQYILIVALLLLVVALVTAWASQSKKIAPKKVTSTTTAKQGSLQAPAQARPIATPQGVSDYEIVGQKTTNTSLRVEVYTKDTETSKVIKLNDALFEHYKASIASKEESQLGQNPAIDTKTGRQKPTTLYIDYFNDKVIATTYFEQISRPSTSKDTKRKLARNYTAMMISSKTLGNTLFRQSNGVEELKKYR